MRFLVKFVMDLDPIIGSLLEQILLINEHFTPYFMFELVFFINEQFTLCCTLF